MLRPQLPKLDDQLGLGFLDLMQLRVVARVVAETDSSLQKLRRALVLARDLVQHAHPFTTARFRSDGRSLFVELGRETATPQRYDLLGRQYGFHRIIDRASRTWISRSRSPDGGRSASSDRWGSIHGDRSEPLSVAIAAFRPRPWR